MSEVILQAGGLPLRGDLVIPDLSTALVLFAHGSGSGRHSPRNRYVASVLQAAGIATLLMDLLTVEEEAIDLHSARLRFDIPLLAERVIGATRLLRRQASTSRLAIGYFGASTGAAAALIAAAQLPDDVGAVVSRGGRPDLAGDVLPRVQAPTLLIVGGDDHVVIALNQQAYDQLRATKELAVVPGATHLFEEPGTLEQVAKLATDWFLRYLKSFGDSSAGHWSPRRSN